MLSFVGHPGRPGDGFSRREILQVGGLGLLGATQAGAALGKEAIAQETLPGFGRAKRCILIYLFGAAPQHETFDPSQMRRKRSKESWGRSPHRFRESPSARDRRKPPASPTGSVSCGR